MGKKKSNIRLLRPILVTVLILAAATAVGILFQYLGFPETNIVIVYLLGVLLAARFTPGYVFGIIASIASTFLFNFFFTEPFYTFSVDDSSYIVTFVIMTVTALITSALTSRSNRSISEARQRVEESNEISQLANRLTEAEDVHGIVSTAVQTVSDTLGCNAACLCFDADGNPEKQFLQQKNDEEQIYRSVENAEEIRQHINGLTTDYGIGPEFYDWPIRGQDSILGILRVPCGTAKELTEIQIRMLHSMIDTTALALDRFRSTQEQMEIREEAERERYRGNLLRAISHDLRTPLSGIMGTSEMLMDMTDPDDERHEMAAGIYQDAAWLHSMVENILSLTKVQEGKLMLNREWEPVEEVVGVAVAAVEKREPGREISVSVPDEVLMVPMDGKLIEQVLINLLDNARKHTPIEKEISLTVDTDDPHQNAVFTVSDQGTGIAKDDLPHIFEMFYTTKGKIADAEPGIGLGLTICKSIVNAHGGTITARNRSDGRGAVFTFTLPLEVKQYGKTD